MTRMAWTPSVRTFLGDRLIYTQLNFHNLFSLFHRYLGSQRTTQPQLPLALVPASESCPHDIH